MRDLVFLPSFSLEPNKVVSYNSVFARNRETETLTPINGKKPSTALKFTSIKEKNSVSRTSHNFQISDNAYRNLKRKINWLYYLAKSKQVKTYSGKQIFNFKIAFITLTLPSKQRTCTRDVTANLLNPFLTEIRQRTEMENYVWRLEFQKNGNVHYHLVTDTYLDYFFVQKIWNRLLKSHGYIDDYKEKFSGLSLLDYNKLTNSNGKTDFKTVAKRYARGCADNWENPNSVDVKSVVSNKAISNYISKYFAKDTDGNPEKNSLDSDDNSTNLRLWFCSRSLSKLKTISDFCEAVTYDIFAIVSHADKARKVIGKYATSIYFEVRSMKGTARKWIELILKSYANTQGYRPASMARPSPAGG